MESYIIYIYLCVLIIPFRYILVTDLKDTACIENSNEVSNSLKINAPSRKRKQDLAEKEDVDSWLVVDSWMPKDNVYSENKTLSKENIPLSDKLKLLEKRFDRPIEAKETRKVLLYDDLETFNNENNSRIPTKHLASNQNRRRRSMDHGKVKSYEYSLTAGIIFARILFKLNNRV